MSDVSKSRIQGLLLAEPITLWEGAGSGVAYTEQSPIPGLPVAGRASHLRPIASGVPTLTTDLELRCQHGGLPGQVDHGATVAVRRAGDTLYSGWEPPGALSGWEAIKYTTAAAENEPDICTLPDDRVIVVTRVASTIVSYTRTTAGTWGAAVTVYSGAREVFWPCLVVVGTAVYCIAWRRGRADQAAGSKYYLSVWESIDQGANWSEVQDYASTDTDVVEVVSHVPGGTKYGVGRLRAAYRSGEVVVLSQLTNASDANHAEFVRQFAGPAVTMRFDTIGTVQGTDGSGAGWAVPDVVATPTGYSIVVLEDTTGVQHIAIGSAWQPMGTAVVKSVVGQGTGAGWTVPTGTVRALTGIGQIALCYDPVGVLHVIASSADSAVQAGNVLARYSPDLGASWQATNASPDPLDAVSGWVWIPSDLNTGVQENYPLEYALCWQRGRAIWAHNWLSAVGSYGDSIAAAYLGGWSDLALPYEEDGLLIGHRAGWLVTWLPYERADDWAGLTTTSGGGGGISTSVLVNSQAGVQRITTGDGAAATGDHYFTWAGTASVTEQVGILECEVAGITGTSSGADQIALRFRLADTGHGVEMALRITPTAVFIIDVVAASTLASVTGLSSGVLHTWRVGMAINGDTGAGRDLQVWYRLTDTSERREWTRVGSYTLADDSGAGGVVPQVEWGHVTIGGSGTQNQSEWRRVQWTAPDESGTDAHWYDLDQTAVADTPGKLPGRPLGSAPVYGIDGFEIAGRRGPGQIGDTWTVPVSGEYDVARATSLVVPSRTLHHRSVDVAADVVIPWAADPSQIALEDTIHPPLMALHVWCNWRLATLQSKTVAGSWTTRATIDMRVLSDLTYARNGKRIVVNQAGQRYFLEDEVDGDWTAEWDNTVTTYYRHLAGNTEGRANNLTAEPRAMFELASTSAGDATGAGDVGKFELWAPRATVIVEAQTCTAWRIVIDSTHGTADGDYRTKFQWGRFHPFAAAPSWGRGFTPLPGHERAELEGGIGADVDRGDPANELRIAWDDGIDESQIYGTTELRYVAGYTSSAAKAGALAATPGSLSRALRRHKGRPVCWATWDRVATGNAVVIFRDAHQLMGTIEAAPTIEVVLGDEGASEVQRVGTVTIREER